MLKAVSMCCRSQRHLLWIALLSLLASGHVAAADPPVLLVHNEKPPFFHTEGGHSTGLVVDIVRKIMDRGGIPHRFESRPFNRILHELQYGQAPYCAIGFSKTPERETFVDFSLPIYKDRSPVFLVRRMDAPEFRRYKTMRALFDNSTFVFGGKTGNAYPIDKQLESLGARDVRVSGEMTALVQMLNAGRFDFMMVYPEERDELIRSAKLTGSSFVDIDYPDMPEGGYRYILCSKRLDPSLLQRINRLIPGVVGKL